MSSCELCISSPPSTCADANDYVRSLLCATLLVGSVAVQCRRLTSFITQASKPTLDLFPRKCTYAQVIDFRSSVLWSIGFIANRYRTPHRISVCPLLVSVSIWQTRSRSLCCMPKECGEQLSPRKICRTTTVRFMLGRHTTRMGKTTVHRTLFRSFSQEFLRECPLERGKKFM